MKKLLGIFVLGLLLNGNVYASLFSLKKYAKCEFKKQEGRMLIESMDVTNSKNFEYFAFDRDNFYNQYNIGEKKFDKAFKIIGETSSNKWSEYFYNQNRSESFQIIFDTATGIMKLKNKGSGVLYFSCNKIGKNKLPKSKF